MALLRPFALVFIFALAACSLPSMWTPSPAQTEQTVTDAAKPESQTAGPKIIIARGIPRVWVDAVTGAPGDGNVALTRSIKQQMADAGLLFARYPGEADYFFTAAVDVVPVDIQTETIKIVWRMTDRRGTEIGQIKQQNAVLRGRLYGPWGNIATLAARGGLQGVLEILRNLGYKLPS